MSSTNSTTDERNPDTVEALKQRVLDLKRKLKKNTQGSRKSERSSRPKTISKPNRSMSTQSSDSFASEFEEEESLDGRKRSGRSLGRGSRGNWSEAPVSTRQLYRARRGQDSLESFSSDLSLTFF